MKTFTSVAFMGCLTLEDEPDTLSQNAGNKLPTFDMQYTRRARTSMFALSVVSFNLVGTSLI